MSKKSTQQLRQKRIKSGWTAEKCGRANAELRKAMNPETNLGDLAEKMGFGRPPG